MNGEEIKKAITACGHTVSDVARRLGMSSQNLSKQLSLSDVKTGLLERIAEALGVPVTYFFDKRGYGDAIASGDYSAASVLGDASVRADGEALLQERVKSLERLVVEKDKQLEDKERTIKILMKNEM